MVAGFAIADSPSSAFRPSFFPIVATRILSDP
jgi:hypothetical protein